MAASETDPFDLLGIPARPVLDAEAVRARFRELAARAHPDAGGDEASYAALAGARDVLLDDIRRVRALERRLGIESGAARSHVPAALADAGFQVEPVLARAHELLRRHGHEPSLLVVAMLTDERIAMGERLLESQARLDKLEQAALDALAEADRRWPEADSSPEVLTEAIRPATLAASELAFLRRWKAQIAECLHRLMVFDAMIP